MENFNTVPSTGKYGDSIAVVNENFMLAQQEMEKLRYLISPDTKFVTAVATAQTTSVTQVLPETGSADTVYRVGSWDGSQYDPSVYSEYAWNGSAYIKLNTKSQAGEVYDISANHSGAKYADLAAALGTNGANIPQSLRKGGMSVKFVQSSDNKYVQYRLMATSFTTEIRYWKDESFIICFQTIPSLSYLSDRGIQITIPSLTSETRAFGYIISGGESIPLMANSIGDNVYNIPRQSNLVCDLTNGEISVVNGNEINGKVVLFRNVSGELTKAVGLYADYIRSIEINTNKDDIAIINKEINGYENDITPTIWALSGYIDPNGTRQGSTSWNISYPISMKAGEKLAVSTQGSGVTVIAKPAVNNYYEPLVKIPGGTSGTNTFYYTAENEMQVVVSAKTGMTGVSVKISKKGISPSLKELQEAFDENSHANPSGEYVGTTGAYIDSSGVYIEGVGSDYKATKDYIPVIPGYRIIFSTSAPFSNFYSALYDINKVLITTFQANNVVVPDGAAYVRVSWYSGSITSGTYTYEAKNSAELIYNVNKNTNASILKIHEELGRIGGGNNIVCWGDSLTQGAGADRLTNLSTVLSVLTSMGFDVTGLSSGASWPTVLQTLIGNEVAVENNGIGGENLKDICCRIGVNPLVANTGFTIPATAGTKVQVAVSELDFAWGGNPTFTFQASKYNPVFVNGVECSFTKHDSSSYDFTRVESGNAIDVKIGDTISFRGVQLRIPKVVVFFMGANGGYNGADDLVAKFKKAVTAVGTPNYLCIYNYAWDAASVTNTKERNAALLAEFGSNFIDLQTYMSGHALEDFGITPTTDADLTSEQIANGVQSDVTLMAAGALPSSLWRNCYGVDGATSNDKHLNAAGYAIVGYKIYERMKILGMI